VQCHIFCQCIQREDESFSTFLSALRELSIDCGFDAKRLDEELQGQIIAGICNKATQNHFLQMLELTLQKVIDKALADKKAYNGVEYFKKPAAAALSNSVNKVDIQDEKKCPFNKFLPLSASGNNNANSTNVADSTANYSQHSFHCGSVNHLANKCVYKNIQNIQCNNCLKMGHLSKVCGINHTYNNSNTIKWGKVGQFWRFFKNNSVRFIPLKWL